MVVFYIVRHGQTLLNSLYRAQGWTDSPLTSAGENTAKKLGSALKEIDFDAAYTSDLSRAAQTAELVLSASGNTSIPIQKDIRLREWCLGSMEAETNASLTKSVSGWLGGVSTFSEFNKRLPDVASAILEHDTTGMAEPFNQITNRLQAALIDIAKTKTQKERYNVLLVTHAFAIKTLFYLFNPECLCKFETVENSTVYQLIYDGNHFYFQHK